MYNRMIRLVIIIGVFGLSIALLASCTSTVEIETPEQYYKGNTVTIAVSGKAGGTSDIWSRIIAPYLADELGATVKVVNYGTEEGVNWVYNEADRDGLTLLSENLSALLLNDLLNAPGVNYETEKFICIADAVPNPYRVFAVSPGFPHKTLKELRQATGLKGGASSARGSLATSCIVMFEIMGLDGKVITGYDGRKATSMAVARGEVDIIVCSEDSAVIEERNGNQVNLFLMGVDDKRGILDPDLPSASEFGVKVPEEWADAYNAIVENGRCLFLPPGVPQERVDYLRQATYNVLEDEKFKAEITNFAGGVWSGYRSGEEVQAAMVKLKNNKELGAQIEALFDKYTAIK